MKRVDFRRVFVIAGLVSLVIIYSILWLRMIGSPSERTGSDFIGFYTAARILQVDGAVHVYDPLYQQMVEQQVVGYQLVPGQVLLFNHLPYFLPLLNLIVDTNYVYSFIRWTILLLIILVINALLLARLMPAEIFRREEIMIAIGGVLLFFPTFTSIMNGQDTVFLLLGMTLWTYGLLHDKDMVSGLGLSLVTVRPQLALILALPILFNRQRRRVWWWFLFGAFLLIVLCLMILGWGGMRNLVNLLLISAGGKWYGLHPEDMPTLSGLIRRTAPGMDAKVIQWISLGIFILAISVLCIQFSKVKKIDERHLGLVVLVSLFVVPYLHYHDLACLLIPIFCLIRILSIGKFVVARNLALIPIAASFTMLGGNLVPIIKFYFPFLVVIFLILVVWFPEKIVVWINHRARGKNEIGG